MSNDRVEPAVLRCDGGDAISDEPVQHAEQPTGGEFWACGRPTGPYQGKFPLGFLERCNEQWGIYHKDTLFPFGGATPERTNWTINDVNEELGVDTHHDARDLPDEWEDRFQVVLSDPPYNREYANELYGVEYPPPKAHMEEAVRVCAPGGVVLILDWLVYTNWFPDDVERDQPIAVTCGPNTRVRILNVFRKNGEPERRWFA